MIYDLRFTTCLPAGKVYDFKNKSVILFLVFFALFRFSLISQTIYKSPKIKINDYGSREQTATISSNIISLNLRDSIISVQSEHPRVEEFLNHQNQFEIIKSFGSGVTTKVYFTSTEYIFTFDLKLRAIVISKKEISPQLHSVWFEEITN